MSHYKEWELSIPPDESNKRLRVFRVSGEVMKMFFEESADSNVKRWVHFEGIEGCNDGKAQVRAVEWNMQRLCFEVVVWHPSFEVVSGNEVIPEVADLHVMSCEAHTEEGQEQLRAPNTQLRRIMLRHVRESKAEQQAESGSVWRTDLPPFNQRVLLQLYEDTTEVGRFAQSLNNYDRIKFIYFGAGDAVLYQEYSKPNFNAKWMLLEDVKKLK